MTHTAFAFILLETTGDLMWLWTLLGVIALFVLGVVAYNVRSRKHVPPTGRHAPEGRIVRRPGAPKSKHQGPYDDGPKVPQDPSSVPKFYHHNGGM